VPISLPSSLIRLREARKAAIARVSAGLENELQRLVADGDMHIYGKFCPDVEALEPERGEIERISWSSIAGAQWNWKRDSISVTKLIETLSAPIHHTSGFGEVSFKRDEFEAQLEKAAKQHVPDKRRGPKPKFDPELIKDILDKEDWPRGEKSQGELARELMEFPDFKKKSLTEAYAEKLVRIYRGT